jgi:hypothetical protein
VSPSLPSFSPQRNVYPRTTPSSAPGRLPSRTNLISPLPGPDRNSRPFNRLRPLELSCLSFGHSYLLFSITCSLFLQNTQGGVPPSARCLNDLKSPSRHSAFPCPLHRHSRVWDPCFTHHSFTPIFEGSLATRLPRSARGHFLLSTFRINTCKCATKQRTLSAFRINTYAKSGEGVPSVTACFNSHLQPI